jgi:dienelactone hydrolase
MGQAEALMKKLLWLVPYLLLISLLPMSWGCGGGQAVSRATVPISLSISPSSATLEASGTQQFTASVSSDPSNAGVAWSVSCLGGSCGTVSPTTAANGVAVTYTAPSTPPLSGLAVTVTARSRADNSKSASATVTIPGLTVSVTPGSASLQAGATQQFAANISNDRTNSGVNWSLTQDGSACSPGCGTISPTFSANGSPIVYSAPATPPSSDLTVAVTATSAALSSATGSATVTVLAINVSIVPISALLPGGTTQQFTVSVGADPTHSGFTLALTENGTACSPTVCGTLSSTNTSPVTYTAPAQVSSPAVVNLTATSVADTTKSTTAGISLTVGTLAIVPYSVDFGIVPKYETSTPQTLTLTNTGMTALSITKVELTGTNFAKFSISSNQCATSLAPLGSCTIAVTFTPDDYATFAANLSITDSSVDSPQQVGLSGTGDVSGSLRAELRSVLANSLRGVTPTPPGPSPVGTSVMDLVDSSRDDPYLGNGTKRELLVRFWYPASLRQGCTPAPYLSPGLRKVYSRLLEIQLPEVRTNSCQNAPVADGFHPVVVFTPGFTAGSTDYTFIFEDLASRGYVVASVDHTYEATAVEFPDGRVIHSIFGSYLGDVRRANRQALTFAVSVRLRDLETVVDVLERLNAEDGSRFAGKLDTTRIALAGHSLGGLTAILDVEKEPRFRAAINLEGGVPDGLITSTVTPVLILAAGREWWSESDRHLWNELRGPRFAVNLEGAEHVTPSDAVWLAKGAVKACAMGPDKAVAAIRSYIAAFLDAYLRGRPIDPLLTGRSPDYPDATVTLQDQSLRQRR